MLLGVASLQQMLGWNSDPRMAIGAFNWLLLVFQHHISHLGRTKMTKKMTKTSGRKLKISTNGFYLFMMGFESSILSHNR